MNIIEKLKNIVVNNFKEKSIIDVGLFALCSPRYGLASILKLLLMSPNRFKDPSFVESIKECYHMSKSEWYTVLTGGDFFSGSDDTHRVLYASGVYCLYFGWNSLLKNIPRSLTNHSKKYWKPLLPESLQFLEASAPLFFTQALFFPIHKACRQFFAGIPYNMNHLYSGLPLSIFLSESIKYLYHSMYTVIDAYFRLPDKLVPIMSKLCKRIYVQPVLKKHEHEFREELQHYRIDDRSIATLMTKTFLFSSTCKYVFYPLFTINQLQILYGHSYSPERNIGLFTGIALDFITELYSTHMKIKQHFEKRIHKRLIYLQERKKRKMTKEQ
mmetsp:Transcript_2030/g.2922  ORF Transcript_2030/g.2922 Transcript_2030/m.2922 type:complete len:328 (-) Transcript_2030:4-987(-)